MRYNKPSHKTYRFLSSFLCLASAFLIVGPPASEADAFPKLELKNPFSGGDEKEKKSGSLEDLPAEEAWERLDANVKKGSVANVIFRTTDIAILNQVDFEKMAKEAEAEAEEASKQAETPARALDEIVADVSEYLVRKLPAHQKVSGSDWRLTLAVGRLVDRSPDQRLQSALDEVAYNLMRNDTFARHFSILSSNQSEAEAIIQDLAGSHPDDIYDPTSMEETGVKKVHPEDLYLLTGETRIFQEDNNRKLITRTIIRVEHPATREVVLSEIFKKTYHFHPADMKYISDAENERRRASEED